MGQIVLDRNSVQVPLLFAALAAGSLWARSSWAPAEPDLRNDGLAAGKFLIAPREPLDPHFATTVVLLISYDESGAVGLVINRPTEIPIARALEGLKPAKKAPGNVYAGGPVQPDSVFALYRAERKPGKGMRLFGMCTWRPRGPLSKAHSPQRELVRRCGSIWGTPVGLPVNLNTRWIWRYGGYYRRTRRACSAPMLPPCGRG